MLPCYLESPLYLQCLARALRTLRDERASLQTNLKWLKCSKFRRVYFASTFQASKEELLLRYIPALPICPLNLKNWPGKNVTCGHPPLFLNERLRQPMVDVYHGNSNLARKQQWSTGPIPFKTENLPFIFGLLSLPFYENFLKKESISPQTNVVKELVLQSKESNKLKLHRILTDICELLGLLGLFWQVPPSSHKIRATISHTLEWHRG